MAVLMVWGIAAATAAPVAAQQGPWWPTSPLGKVDLKNVYAGDPLDETSLWGKPVLVVFWKTNDRAAQKALADADALVGLYQRAGLVGVGGYLGQADDRAKTAQEEGAKARRLTIVPGERFDLNIAVAPHMAVYDYNGTLVWQGFPDAQTLNKSVVPLLTKLARENPGHPVLDTNYELLGPIVAKIRRDKLGEAMADCAKWKDAAGNDNVKKVAAQATRLHSRLTAYASYLQGQASKATDSSPAQAIELYTRLSKLFAGSSLGDHARKRLTELADDPVFQINRKAEPGFRTIQRLIENSPPRPSGGPEREAWDKKYATLLQQLKAEAAKMEADYPGSALTRKAKELIEGKSSAVSLDDLKLPGNELKMPGDDTGDSLAGAPARTYPPLQWAQSPLAAMSFTEVWAGPELTADDLVGQVVVLVFYKHDDPAAIRGLNDVARVAKAYRRNGLVSVAVAMGGPRGTAVDAARRVDFPSTVIHVAKAKAEAAARTKAYPHAVVYNHLGRAAWQGAPDDKMLAKIVECIKNRPEFPMLDGGTYPNSAAIVSRMKRDRLGDALNVARKSRDQSGPAGVEARKLMTYLEAYGGWLLQRARMNPLSSPTATTNLISRIARQYEGTEIAEDAQQLLKKLVAHPEFLRERKAEAAFLVIARDIESLPSRPAGGAESEDWDRRFGRRAADIKKRLEKMKVENPEANFTLRAADLLEKRLDGKPELFE
ncbi:MAG: hypothetical protein ABFD92_20760 [Planctomycetaceae bacterium]|nr:hypothetical protein [Planctomycetaceae bacterium]